VGSGICVIPVEGDPNVAVRALLNDEHVMVTARGGGVRLSTHYFNTEEDIVALISAIERIGIRPG
jgi:selenocysteine lyase/cysteine desulfurase